MKIKGGEQPVKIAADGCEDVDDFLAKVKQMDPVHLSTLALPYARNGVGKWSFAHVPWSQASRVQADWTCLSVTSRCWGEAPSHAVREPSASELDLPSPELAPDELGRRATFPERAYRGYR